MLVAIHQLHYLPWLRYVEKIQRADLFVVLDDAQYTKGDWHNRNRVKGPAGPVTLTVPVRHARGRTIRDTEIVHDGWRDKHRRSLEVHYGGTPGFAGHAALLEGAYGRPWARLGELARLMLEGWLDALGIRTRLVYASELGVEGRATGRLVAICRAVGARAYYSGRHAIETYLDRDAFGQAGIELVPQDWRTPEYPQRYPEAGFVPDLAICDLLWNVGPDAAREVLARGGGHR